MRTLLFGVAVWGESYLSTFLRLALPSYLASGNIPACSRISNVKFIIVTRPQDVPLLENSPVWNVLSEFAEVEIKPSLTPDMFEGNRYTVMARAHAFLIKESLRCGAVLSILSPDCIVSDGSLLFALKKILDGNFALLIPGPRAILEEAAPILTAAPFLESEGRVIAVPSRDLVALLVQHLHPISQLLFWNATPFSAFPSTIYWSAGQESLLAKCFHLHPLFIDMATASPETEKSGSIDGSLITLSGISPNRIYRVKSSDDVCVIELSQKDHDPMGSVPFSTFDKSAFLANWAETYVESSHIDQFRKFVFLFSGREDVDWKSVIDTSNNDMEKVFFALEKILFDRQIRLEQGWKKGIEHQFISLYNRPRHFLRFLIKILKSIRPTKTTIRTANRDSS